MLDTLHATIFVPATRMSSLTSQVAPPLPARWTRPSMRLLNLWCVCVYVCVFVCVCLRACARVGARVRAFYGMHVRPRARMHIQEHVCTTIVHVLVRHSTGVRKKNMQ